MPPATLPMNALTPALRTRLQAELTASFDQQGLQQFATERLTFDDVKFADEVNFNQGKADVAFALVETAVQHGRLAELVFAVRDARPGRPEAAALLPAFGLGEAEQARAATALVPPDVRDTVLLFEERFRVRQRLFGYLNAYKQLHDLLHHLSDFRKQLESAVDALVRTPDDPPDPAGITDPLSIWVSDARGCVAQTEFPKMPPRWIGRFEAAVATLTAELGKTDPAAVNREKLNRTVEVLAHLPAEEQKGLNTRLVECATRLETDELVDLMDRILAELTRAGAGGGATDELRTGVAGFRILCRALADLIADHNRCQDVDEAMREAEGLVEVTPSELSQWADIKAALEEIAARRKGDLRADRALAAATGFEEGDRAAGQAADDAKVAAKRKLAQAFQRLQERFSDLFFYTDKTLLKATQDLLSAAQALDATLKRF